MAKCNRPSPFGWKCIRSPHDGPCALKRKWWASRWWQVFFPPGGGW